MNKAKTIGLRGISPTRSRSFNIAIAMLILFVLAMALGSALSPYDPLEVDLATSMLSPSVNHWFGTDDLGGT